MSELVVQVIDARCSIAGHRIFSGIGLDLRAGERVHVAGPNGSGKTTILRCIGGTMSIDGGSILVGGAAAGSRRASRLTGLCVNPEQGLHLRLSGHDNLLFAARLRVPHRQVDAEVAGLENELGITAFATSSVQKYSAGMRSRVTIARALIGRPALLLLDEPTRSLDDAGQELFWAAIDARPEAACLIASHLPEDREKCDRSLELTVATR